MKMWNCALIANRLIETLGRAHQSLLDGSFVFADIGYLVCASPGYGGEITDAYPVADRYPQEFARPEDWQRYASLIKRLRDVAPLVGVNDQSVFDILCTAEQIALARHEFAIGRCDQSAVGRASGHFDRVEFSKAYWRIRSAVRARLRGLIPDCGKMWAETFGRWAIEVSAEEAALQSAEAMPVKPTELARSPEQAISSTKTDAVEQKKQELDGEKRRGRLSKEESEAKRAHLLATVSQHPSLKDDPAALARMIGVSESTIRRWLDEEEKKYLDSKSANPDPDEVRPEEN